ncbi:hypothetical protein CLOM_g4628 [Closterium sp. NIES-68]|nr:hypothetical protein CLOM_g4628 [Closterium sp. NIES-68]GJP85753.1 hypothetical protein CLOP_g15852 [Closterium sp. NIES-67]
MDLSDPSPMVNGEQMRRFVGRKIRTVLRVVRVDPGVITAQTCDNATVTVRAVARSPWDDSQFVEVIGVPENDTTIREESSTAFGNNFDQGNYNQLCTLVHGEFHSLFLPS